MSNKRTKTKITAIRIKRLRKKITIRIKASKRKKITCLTFFAFYAFCTFYAFYAFYACEITLNNLMYYTTMMASK